MQTTTEFTWMLVTFALLMAFANGTSIGEVNLVWGSAMILDIPFQLMGALMSVFPLFAPIFLIGLLYYFGPILHSALGEGLVMFVVASVIILIAGV